MENIDSSKLKARQIAFQDYLSITDGLIALLSEEFIYKGLQLDLQQTNNIVLPLLGGKMLVGQLTDVFLVEKKYFFDKNQSLFISQGLTQSDYTITLSNIDPTGGGIGRKLAQSNASLVFNCEKFDIDVIGYDCIFIGGDTIIEVNFSHWIFEHLPKIYAMKLAGVNLDLPIIVSDRLPQRFLNWCEELLDRKLNFVKKNLTRQIFFTKKVYVSSPGAYRTRDKMHPTLWFDGFDYLSEKLITKANDVFAIKETPKAIFVGRASKTKWRVAENEEDVFKVINRYVECSSVDLSSMSILEQIYTVNSADIVIFFGGADGVMANFCNPRAKVVEIMPPNAFMLYCIIFCMSRSIKYFRHQNSKFIGEKSGPLDFDRNYQVNVESFENFFRKVID